MATVNIYLTYKGNCEEAFNLYKSVFGGEFGYVGRYKEMPGDSGMCPPEDLEKIMHISLPVSKETVLMGCDGNESAGVEIISGNNFDISVNTDSQQEADHIFKGLAEGGMVTMPMNKTFWGAYYGKLTDKFGIHWMVSYEGHQS